MSRRYITKNKFCYNHPDKLNHALGLCRQCYTKQLYSQPNSRKKIRVGYNKYLNNLKLHDPEKLWKMRRNNKLTRLYGITSEDYDRMLEQQQNKCAICGRDYEGTLHVDHNHQTGKIRELLCPACNFYVGLVENIALLIKVQQYLAKHE